MKNSNYQRVKAIISLVVFSIILWISFGPIQLGGPVSYIIISGNSMEPGFYEGDLIVARQYPSYQVNQQVVYDHPDIGFVFHRIVDQDQNGFILKGDHNDWLDSYQPTDIDILGKYWFMIPGAGELIRTIREPVNFVLFVVILLGVVISLFLFQKENVHRHIKGYKRRMIEKQNPKSTGNIRQELLLYLGIIATAALVLAVISFIKPKTILVADDIYYKHQGRLVYSASNVGGVYDLAGIKTGDPIYPELNCKMDLDFSYQFSSMSLEKDEKESLANTITVTAILSDDDGWNRSFLLIPEYAFTGTSIKGHSPLNICKILELIEHKELKTGAEIRFYTLSIHPEVYISGTIGGIPVQDTFAPNINFDLGQTVLRFSGENGGFEPELEGSLPQTAEMSNYFLVFGRQVDVTFGRRLSMIVLGMSLLGAIYPAWSLMQEWGRSNSSRIQIQHQPLLIDIKSGSLKKQGQKIIEVTDFEDLRKIAERYGALIMHEDRGEKHLYAVQDEGILYQYLMDNSLDSNQKESLPEVKKKPSETKEKKGSK